MACRRSDQRKFCLKRIKLAKQTLWQREATIREVTLMRRLSHPFIVVGASTVCAYLPCRARTKGSVG